MWLWLAVEPLSSRDLVLLHIAGLAAAYRHSEALLPLSPFSRWPGHSLGLVALCTLVEAVMGGGVRMCLLSPLQLHIPLVTLPGVYATLLKCASAVTLLHACSPTCKQLLTCVCWCLMSLCSISPVCPIPVDFPACCPTFQAGRLHTGLIPAAKSLMSVSCLARVSLWYSLPLEHILPQKYSQLALQLLPWALVD